VAVAFARALAPLYASVDGFVSSWVGGHDLLLFVAHFDPPEPTAEAVREIERRIEHVRETCRLLPLDEALERLARGDLPPRPAVLFVDDATRSFYATGYPILRRLEVPFVLAILPGLIEADDHDAALAQVLRVASQGNETAPATIEHAVRRVTGKAVEIGSYSSFFLVARELDTNALRDLRDALGLSLDPLMTWAELAASLRESRVEIANHSMSHPLMKHVVGEWLEFEVVRSRSRIQTRLGIATRDFVFPYGTAENASPVVVEAIRRASYRAAYRVRMGVAKRGDFLLSRAPLEARAPLDALTASHALNAIATFVRPRS
jgi:peptidoglycan/xylan/chitin deacetylase (PgdA/CDA1 family)